MRPRLDARSRKKIISMRIWRESEMRRIPLHEELIIGGDLNGHVGKERSNFEREHVGYGYGQQNPEGESILSFAQAYNLLVANTFIFKRKMST